MTGLAAETAAEWLAQAEARLADRGCGRAAGGHLDPRTGAAATATAEGAGTDVKLSRLLLVYFPLLVGVAGRRDLYFAYNPGHVTLNWLGYRIDMLSARRSFLVVVRVPGAAIAVAAAGDIVRSPQQLLCSRAQCAARPRAIAP